MNVEKINSIVVDLSSRKMDFIKYANKKSFSSNQTKTVTDCFNSSIERENKLIALNFIA